MNDRDGLIMLLQETPGVGPAAMARVLARYGMPDAMFFGRDDAYYQSEFRLSSRAAGSLSRVKSTFSPPDLPVRALTLLDTEYPRLLREWKGPPPVLWTHESARIELTFSNLCVVCSANREEEHAEAIKEALNAAISAGYRLIAGHNRPVYQWALLAAKRCGAPSVMALDRGLLEAFDGDLSRDPIAAARIWGYGFDAEHCMPLSPFRLRDGWIGSNSRLRDALVVGLSGVVVAFGICPGGTIYRLCREALARGRTVYADTGSLSLLAGLGAHPWDGHLTR